MSQLLTHNDGVSRLKDLVSYLVLYFSEIPIITVPSERSFDDGSLVNVGCKATGNPVPDVRWVHNGQVLSSGTGTAHLFFSKIAKENAGIYTCKANNSAGSTEKQLDVLVKCKYYTTVYIYTWIACLL